MAAANDLAKSLIIIDKKLYMTVEEATKQTKLAKSKLEAQMREEIKGLPTFIGHYDKTADEFKSDVLSIIEGEK